MIAWSVAADMSKRLFLQLTYEACSLARVLASCAAGFADVSLIAVVAGSRTENHPLSYSVFPLLPFLFFFWTFPVFMLVSHARNASLDT